MIRIVAIVLVVALLLGCFVSAGLASFYGITARRVGVNQPGASVRDQSITGPGFVGGGPGAGK